MNYARAVRTCRAALGWQQKELAEKSGLTTSYLSLLEAGKRKPKSETLSKISEAMGIPSHLLALLAAESEDLESRPKEEISVLAKSLLEKLVAGDEGNEDGLRSGVL